MSLFKLFNTNKKFYVYDTYYNILTEIDPDFYHIIEQNKNTKEYYNKIKEYNLRDIFNNKVVNITNCLDDENYQWKIENR